MALDTLIVKALTEELSKKLTDGRIDKIHQPERDEIVMHVRTYSENYKLVISASPAHPRIHFASVQKENPMTPPMFCMLLRKHLSSGKIIKISQIDYERIIRFDIESYNELGDLTVKYLTVELMGRNSNIILTDSELKIIDSARHVDFTQSSVRQILPGCIYLPPPPQEKTPALSEALKSVVIDWTKAGETPDKAIMNAVSGLSPLSAREVVQRAVGSCSLVCGELSDSQKQKIEEVLKSGFLTKSSPCMLVNVANGKITDFSAIGIEQYGDSVKILPYDSVCTLLDEYYRKKDSAERMKQKSSDLVKLLKNHQERLTKKSIIQMISSVSVRL